MKSKSLLILAASAILGLAACGQPQSSATGLSSQSSHATGLSSSESSHQTGLSSSVDTTFDGDISGLTVGVDADVKGVVAQVLSKGFTLADGKAAVYVYYTLPSDGSIKLGDYVAVTGTTEKYYGVYEINKATVTKIENPTVARGLDDIVKTETAATNEIVTKFFDDVTAAKAEGVDPYDVTKNVPYKITGVVAKADTKGKYFELAEGGKHLCPHYYLPAQNRTVANRETEIYADCKYDVSFYFMGTNSSNHIDIHVYDVTAHYDAVTSLTLDKESVTVEVEATTAVTPTVAPATADQGVAWAIEDETIATVNNGTVKGVKEGSTKLIATSKGDATKKVEIPVTVTAKTVSYTSIGALSLNKNANVTIDNKLEDATDPYIEYSENGVKIQSRKGTSTTNVNVWKADFASARFYQDSILTFADETAFAKIVLTCDSGYDYSNAPEGTTIEGATYSVDSHIFTIVLAQPTTSFSFKPAKQVRISNAELFKIA